MSTGKEYSFSLTISGAIYDRVPQNTLSLEPYASAIENPKSMSLIYFVAESNKIFSSLMSLWTTCLRWQYCMASTSCLKNGLASSSVHRLFSLDFMIISNDVQDGNSMTK